jgi:hypothetical protein
MQPFASRLKAEAVLYVRLRDRLIAEFPDLDETTLADTLEGSTDVQQLLTQLIRSALEDEALSAGLSTRLAEMRSRVERLKLRADKKRALALAAMNETEIKTLVEPDFSVSVRRGAPALQVLEEERIPAPFWKPQPPKLDRLSLLAALKEGQQIEGAALAPSQPQLSVRTK